MAGLADSTRAAVADKINESLNAAQSAPVKPPARRGRPPKNAATAKAAPVASAAKTPPATETERIVKGAKDRSHTKDTANAPDFSEWSEFLGEVVLHWFAVAFVAVALRGLPYHEIFSEADYEDIQLDEDELKSVARPFAHILAHSNLNGKYGRAIMNSRDSIEAVVVLFMWMSRVNRIGKKYKRLMMEVPENVARIPRPDRARDSTEENLAPEAVEPIAGIARSAFGHGFN